MKQMSILILAAIFSFCYSETLFEVKDASNNKVLDVSTDGLRVYNQGNMLMEISSSAIAAYISDAKGLSRTFSVTTTSSKKGLANVLEIGKDYTTMREGDGGYQYTEFSPLNMFLGLNAGASIDGGKYNVFIGNYSGNTTTGDEVPDMFEFGYYNTFLGYASGRNATNSFYNTYIGANSGELNTNGSDNTFVGTNTGSKNTGSANTFLGYASGGSYTGSGSQNTFIGGLSGTSNTSGNANVFVGMGAGESNQTGYDNTYIGRYAGGSGTSGYGNVFLGRSAGSQETGSNKLYIDNSNTTTPLIYGDFLSNALRFNGNVGIGKYPSYTFDVLDDYVGIYSEAATTTGSTTYAIFGRAGGGSTTNYGIYGTTSGTTGTNWAGYFSGNINVTGTVVKTSDEIKMDHPLDPKNQFLSHSTIASDQMTNIYHGNVVLDFEGKAIVELPEWLEAINTDFRYQLTAIGAPGPNLFVSKEITSNSFEIAGGNPNMKVSWQVTGIRNDNYAKANPIEIETIKDSIDKGYYLHPEAYGLSKENGIEYQHLKEMNNKEK